MVVPSEKKVGRKPGEFAPRSGSFRRPCLLHKKGQLRGLAVSATSPSLANIIDLVENMQYPESIIFEKFFLVVCGTTWPLPFSGISAYFAEGDHPRMPYFHGCNDALSAVDLDRRWLQVQHFGGLGRRREFFDIDLQHIHPLDSIHLRDYIPVGDGGFEPPTSAM